MARDWQQGQFSAETVNRSPNNAGPSPNFHFSVKVRPCLPDFLNSVNLKYVKLGYHYLISHSHNYRFYFFIAPLLLTFIFTRQTRKYFTCELDLYCPKFLLGISIALILYIYHKLAPRSIYLVDFSCYRPPHELKISKDEFIRLATKSGDFSDASIEFQQRILKNSGIGDDTYMPRVVFRPNYKISLEDGREEAAMAMFGAVNDLFAVTKIRPSNIGILIVNCGILNTTPSLSSMVINRFKLRHDIRSFNLGGMGCAAGIIAIDLSKDLLKAYGGSYALVVSTEAVTHTWYKGNDLQMLLPNCFFRMGAAAMLLSSSRQDRWRAKYQLKQVVRTHKGMDDRSFKSIRIKEDDKGTQGLQVSKDIMEVGGHALKANISTLGPLVLPLSQHLRFFTTLMFKNKTTTTKAYKPYIPNYKLAFEHVCILSTSRKVLDEIQRNLQLTEEYMEASRKTLERFGNTSSSSMWYELSYLEWRRRIKSGDRVWQIAFGSGFKCGSVVWKALSRVGRPKRQSPWDEN